jgi:alpha-tubulin suppressor-like RCC1 family protein
MVIYLDQGAVYTFGRNDKGQLGDKTLKSRSKPVKIDLSEPIIDAATGRSHTILLTSISV